MQKFSERLPFHSAPLGHLRCLSYYNNENPLKLAPYESIRNEKKSEMKEAK